MKYCCLRFPNGKPKAVTLSFDDGPHDDKELTAIMNKYGIKGTFNLNSAYVTESGDGWHLTIDEVKKYILDAGHEIAVHGEEHIAPGMSRPVVAITDILNCRRSLEEKFGIIIRGMAYPDSGIRKMTNSNTYEDIKKYISELDIVYSRTLGGDNDNFQIPNDFLNWMPTAYHKNPGLFDAIDKFLAPFPNGKSGIEPKLFYIWGHSYEFRVDGNWNIIERACEKLGNKEDIWYATNMQIYEYVTGYRHLVFSADSKTVYNPNLFDIWFDADGKGFCVKSGETLKINI